MKAIQLYLGISICILAFACSGAQNQSPDNYKKETNDSYLQTSYTEHLINKSLAFDSLSNLILHFNHKIDSLFMIKREIFKNKEKQDKDLIESLDSVLYAIQQEKNEAIYDFILANEKNSKNLEGVKYLVLDRKVNISQVEDIFKKFPATEQNSAQGKWLSSKIEERKKAELMLTFDLSLLDLKFETAEGAPFTLRQLSSRYILLDFWASWCTPCRYENRKLVKEKEAITKGNDISIIAVSTDVNKARWLKAVNDDGLNYISICDFQDLKSPIAKAFKINSIPFNVLISKDGRILAINLWGDRLIDFINALK